MFPIMGIRECGAGKLFYLSIWFPIYSTRKYGYQGENDNKNYGSQNSSSRDYDSINPEERMVVEISEKQKYSSPNS